MPAPSRCQPWAGAAVCSGIAASIITGLVVTVVSTMCCGLAWNLESLIFFRVIQGLSAAPAQVTGMVILYEAFPPGQRGLVLGLLLLAGSLGPTIGPSLGGYLVQEYSWRAMFYLSLPTAVLSLILTPMCCQNCQTRASSGRCLGVTEHGDLGGGAAAGREPGATPRAGIRHIFAACLPWPAVFFVGFLLLELLQKQPFVDLRLYRNLALC